jgi:hypothetical protein
MEVGRIVVEVDGSWEDSGGRWELRRNGGGARIAYE